MRLSKRILAAVLACVLCFGIVASGLMLLEVKAASVAGTTVKYTFADYEAGTQYAENEEHKLDENVTVVVNDGHFTTQIRLYASSSHDSTAVIKTSTAVSSVVLNCGNKAATLNVYFSNDEGATWTLAQALTTTSKYADHTVTFNAPVTHIKLDAVGDQVRVAYMTVSFAANTDCEHTNVTEDAIGKAESCTEDGYTPGKQCDECGSWIEGHETIPATGHTFQFDAAAVTCEKCDYNQVLNTIAEAKAYEAGTVYYVKGVITFIDSQNYYIQDDTGAILIRLNSVDAELAIGDELYAWGDVTTYNGLLQISGLSNQEYVKISSGNEVEAQDITLETLMADTTNEYLAEKINLSGLMVTQVGTWSSQYKNINYTVSDGTNEIVLYRTPLAAEEDALQVGDIVDLPGVIVSTNSQSAYQLRVVNDVPYVGLDTKMSMILNNEFSASFRLRGITDFTGYNVIVRVGAHNFDNLTITADGVVTVPVKASQLNDDIVVSLYDDGGLVVFKEYNCITYMQGIIDDEAITDAELKAICEKVIAYSAALENAIVAEPNASTGTAPTLDAALAGTTTSDSKDYQAQLIVTNGIVLNIKLDESYIGKYVSVNGGAATLIETANDLIITIEGIKVIDWEVKQKIVVSDPTDPFSTIEYSVMSYVYDYLTTETAGTESVVGMYDLMIAIAEYWQAVEAAAAAAE